MEVKKVGLLGGRGYVGQEVIKLLGQHKHLNISSVFSLSKAGQPLEPDTDSGLLYQDLGLENIVLADEDAFILALPNNESAKYIDLIFRHNSKAIIIDLSADHRFDDVWEYRVPELSNKVMLSSYPDILFTPLVGNFFRGIIMTGNFILSETMLAEEIYNLFISYYDQKSLISIQRELPNMQDVQNTSNVIIGGFEVDKEINRLTFCCTLDNLLKGAATQAVQNLNSAFGWEDNLGIT